MSRATLRAMIFGAIVSLTCVVTATISGQAVDRGQPAKASLNSSFQTLGWFNPATPGPIDVLAVGTLTYYSADDGSVASTVAVTIKCRGSQHYRIDVNDPNGAHSTVVNGLGGAFIKSDGTQRPLTASSAISIQGPVFPFLLDELNPANPQTFVEDIGLNGAPAGIAQRLHISLPASTEFLAGLRSRASEKTVWLSSNGTPARIDFFRVAGDNHYVRVPFTLLLSDYRQVSGLLVPFQLTELLDGNKMTSLTFQTVTIGAAAGIVGTEFTVPAAVSTGGAQ
jgi:hypothetical protein